MPRWLLPTLALSALVGFALAWVAYLEPWARRGPFWDKYQQVRLRMSQSEVEGILGPPALEEGATVLKVKRSLRVGGRFPPTRLAHSGGERWR
jgi:hypothetical protein